jgi:hypothetical protein
MNTTQNKHHVLSFYVNLSDIQMQRDIKNVVLLLCTTDILFYQLI